MLQRLVDAVTAETQADLLRLHAQLHEISTTAPEVLAALKVALDSASRVQAASVGDIQASHQALGTFVSKRNADLLAELSKRADDVQARAATRDAAAQLAGEHLAAQVRRLTWVVALSLGLHLVTLVVLVK